ncbi:MAG TPA: imidazoleglycerol-phosphate dehydratase HisB [Candidatus Tectomicrobia bacterium]|nr:imidazoleglycerol-phosphate dehydratase HisB [Candidatus Tectomicrobia bacterium]
MSTTRSGLVSRTTKETDIQVSLMLDGSGVGEIGTGVPFFDHMLTSFTRYGLFDLDLRARGDLDVDYHHTVEDVGICLGEAFDRALGAKEGIQRYGHVVMPMDEALVSVTLDICSRPYLIYHVTFPGPRIGTSFPSELVQEFFQGFIRRSGLTLHINMQYGTNSHHIAEAIFKGVGRAMGQACALDPRIHGVLSTKGEL